MDGGQDFSQLSSRSAASSHSSSNNKEQETGICPPQSIFSSGQRLLPDSWTAGQQPRKTNIQITNTGTLQRRECTRTSLLCAHIAQLVCCCCSTVNGQNRLKHVLKLVQTECECRKNCTVIGRKRLKGFIYERIITTRNGQTCRKTATGRQSSITKRFVLFELFSFFFTLSEQNGPSRLFHLAISYGQLLGGSSSSRLMTELSSDVATNRATFFSFSVLEKTKMMK